MGSGNKIEHKDVVMKGETSLSSKFTVLISKFYLLFSEVGEKKTFVFPATAVSVRNGGLGGYIFSPTE